MPGLQARASFLLVLSQPIDSISFWTSGHKKKALTKGPFGQVFESVQRLCNLVSLTDTLLRPFLLRALSTFLPAAVLMRSLKPCLFRFFLLEGWNVLFMAL